MTPSSKPQAIEAMEHVLCVFKSLADRGRYPDELLPYLEGVPNSRYLGKQGWEFLTDALAALRADEPSTPHAGNGAILWAIERALQYYNIETDVARIFREYLSDVRNRLSEPPSAMQRELEAALSHEGAKDNRIAALEAALDWAVVAVFEHYTEGEAPTVPSALEEIEQSRARVIAECERLSPTKMAPPGDRCDQCNQPLPPVAMWSMPSCPICVDKAERAGEKTALCPHGMPLAENICGPCSEGRPNRPADETDAALFYILSLKHSKESDQYMTLWRANDQGYTIYLPAAGKYTRQEVEARPSYYNNGERSIAVACHIVEQLAVAAADGYDSSGPVVPNEGAFWTALIERRLSESETG